MDEGARHFRDIAGSLGAGDCCGQCVREVKDVMREYRQQKTGAGYAAPVLFQPA